MHFRSLIISFESIVAVTKELVSLATLIASIVFNDSFGVKTIFISFKNEVLEMGRVLSEKP